MVDAIKTTVNRLEPTKGRASEGRSAGAGVATVAPSPSVDKVTVSSVASSKAHTQLPRHRLSIWKLSSVSRMRLHAVNILLTWIVCPKR